MRLSRLDLTRYGKFTDHNIAFGPVQVGVADLHIVYGPNEAGKSTALAAYLDILYGIENRSAFDFIHPYASMEIGAALDIDSLTHEVVRLKRAKHSLVGADNQAISEDLFKGELAGMDRQAYCTLYSLDDDTIEAGGESILASDGNLGELLYAATAGIADLSQQLSDIHSASDAFFKTRSKSDELSGLKNSLSELNEHRSKLDTVAHEYQRLVEDRDKLKAEYDATGVELSGVKLRIEELQRLLRALPRLLDLRAIQEELSPLANLPDAPDSWSAELPALRDTGTELSVRTDAVSNEIKKLKAEISSSSSDDTALAQLDHLPQFEQLRARHNSAAEDLPERQAELTTTNSGIERILRQLDKGAEAEPSDLILPVSVTGSLQAHAKKYATIESSLQSADREFLNAEQNLQHTKARLLRGFEDQRAEPGSAATITLLRDIVNDVRNSDASVREAVAAKSRTKYQADFDTVLYKLNPWSGEVAQLSAMQIPDKGDVQSWKTALEQVHSTLNERRMVCERLESDLLEHEAEVKSIGASTGITTAQAATDVRAMRDQAWSVHKNQLEHESAIAFEELLHKDDQLTTARITHSHDVARLTESARAMDVVKAKLSRARELHKVAIAELESINNTIKASVKKVDAKLPEDFSLVQFESWLVNREDLLGIAYSIAECDREIHTAKQELESLRQKLCKSLLPLKASHIPANKDDDLETGLLYAQQYIEQESELSSLRALLAESERSVEHRCGEQLIAAKTETDWKHTWKKLCSTSWFGQTDELPAVETVQEIILQTTQLASALEEQNRIQGELDKFQSYQAAYEKEVYSLAKALKLTTDKSSVMDLDRAIRERIEQAVSNQRKLNDAQQILIEKTALADDLERQSRVNAKQSLMITAHLGVNSLIDAEQGLQNIKVRQSLLQRQKASRLELLETMQLQSVEQAEAALDSVVPTNVNQELAALENQLSGLEVRYRELHSSYVKATDGIEAVGGDESVAKIEEQRQTILLEIQDKALRYFKQKAGIIATEQALRVYRDRHQSSMMAQASAAFKRISRGNYTKLTTRPGKDSEILIGVTADGGSKLSTEMSKGTRFQLYLALRIAGYYEFARSRTPVPFIADDIMETFDNERAEETLGIFADMAMKGQVIYLTHHEHLCNLAKKVCPTVSIHDLRMNRPDG